MEETSMIVESESQFERLEFTGTGGEYFRIWIVNLFLTILTFGIYSAWAKVRTNKYFLQKTIFKGSGLDFHASALPILLGRIITVFLLFLNFVGGLQSKYLSILSLVLLVLLIPTIIVKSISFKTQNTSYRNIRFHFLGKITDFYKTMLRASWLPTFFLITLVGLNFYFREDILNAQNSPQAAEKAQLALILFMANLSFIFIANFISFSKMANAFYGFIFNHLYYGGQKIKFDDSLLKTKKELTYPYFKAVFSTLLLGIVAGVVGTLSTTLFKSHEVISGLVIVILIFFFYVGVICLTFYFPYLIQKYIWNNISLDEVEVKNDLKWSTFLKLNLGNLFLMIFTFGLYYPWAKIKVMKLLSSSRMINIHNLNSFTDIALEKESAVYDQMAQGFDLDFDIGI